MCKQGGSPRRETGHPLKRWVRRQRPYGDLAFARASRGMARLRPDAQPRLMTLLGALTHVQDLAFLVAYVRSLPEVRVVAVSEHDEVAAYFAERRCGVPRHRWAQAVLPTAELASYLRGRHRQAVRTNLHHAEALPLTVHALTAHQAWTVVPELATRVPLLHKWADELATRPHDLWWSVTRPDGTTCALAAVSASAPFGLLNLLVADPTDSARHAARYLLHTHMVDALFSAGVTHLFVRGADALVLRPGLQYFQRLTGYELVNVKIGRRLQVVDHAVAAPTLLAGAHPLGDGELAQRRAR